MDKGPGYPTLLDGSKPAGPKTSIASGGPPRREASARATRWVARATHLSFRFVLGAPPTRRCLRALRLGSLYPNKRTAIPLGIALFALSSSGRSLRGPQQRQLRASAAGGFGPRDSTSRKCSA